MSEMNKTTQRERIYRRAAELVDEYRPAYAHYWQDAEGKVISYQEIRDGGKRPEFCCPAGMLTLARRNVLGEYPPKRYGLTLKNLESGLMAVWPQQMAHYRNRLEPLIQLPARWDRYYALANEDGVSEADIGQTMRGWFLLAADKIAAEREAV